MPRPTQTEELELIASIVAAHSGGIGIAGIEAEMARHLGEKPNRRTLQRRLRKLVQGQRLATEGESIAAPSAISASSLMPTNPAQVSTCLNR